MIFYTRRVNFKKTLNILLKMCLVLKGKSIKRSILATILFVLFPLQQNVFALQNDEQVTAAVSNIITSFLTQNRDPLSCPNPGSSPDDNAMDSNFFITNQVDIDALTGVTRVANLRFVNLEEGVDLDLSPLDSLIEVTGIVDFRGEPISSISGFSCLTTAGALFIENNPNLTSIEGFGLLSSLTSVSPLNNLSNGFQISDNPNLITVPNFESLVSVADSFQLLENEQLVNLPEFPLLETIGGNMIIESNNSMISFPEFQALTSVGEFIFINDNISMVNLLGFELLVSAGNVLNIAGNTSLVNITDFNSLVSLGGTSGGSFVIADNPLLPALPELPLLTDVNSTIFISNNDSITDIPEYPSIFEIGFDIQILDNESLVDVSGFTSLTEGVIRIERNSQLQDVSGFNQFSSEGGRLNLIGNPVLQEITGFQNLTTLDVLSITDNDILDDLSAFVGIPTLNSLSIERNSQLQEISGFDGLAFLGSLVISGNANLEQISGFNALSGNTNVIIEENPSLELISGFSQVQTFFLGNGITITDNEEFNCDGQIQNLIPIDFSEGNEVDCENSGIQGF